VRLQDRQPANLRNMVSFLAVII